MTTTMKRKAFIYYNIPGVGSRALMASRFTDPLRLTTEGTILVLGVTRWPTFAKEGLSDPLQWDGKLSTARVMSQVARQPTSPTGTMSAARLALSWSEAYIMTKAEARAARISDPFERETIATVGWPVGGERLWSFEDYSKKFRRRISWNIRPRKGDLDFALTMSKEKRDPSSIATPPSTRARWHMAPIIRIVKHDSEAIERLLRAHGARWSDVNARLAAGIRGLVNVESVTLSYDPEVDEPGHKSWAYSDAGGMVGIRIKTKDPESGLEAVLQLSRYLCTEFDSRIGSLFVPYDVD